MEFIINIEWVLCVLVVIGGVVMIFAGGDKKSAKRLKIVHCMEKRGVESSFLKIIKSTVYCEE